MQKQKGIARITGGKMTQLECIVQAFENIGGKGTCEAVFAEVEKIENKKLTALQKARIKNMIEDHSSDSKSFKGHRDLFYAVRGIRRGYWGLR